MADAIDAQIDAAERQGRDMLDTQPRAAKARYDRLRERVVVELVNGCTYTFPVRLVQDLQGATHDDLGVVQVEGLGFDLHWPKLDVDLYVPALVTGQFGTRAWMHRELARVAGQSTSPRKAAAARANGLKGGRPRKSAGA